MTDRKKPGVACWASVVLVVVLLGYPLSFGPACWISSRCGKGDEFVSTTYEPLLRMAHGTRPRFIGRSLAKYGALLRAKDWGYHQDNNWRCRWAPFH